ncbi:MAG: glycoside hydrolase family 3 N-terminal domain-containing protein, partial [Alphaproteobacteria bacterium]
MGTLSAAIYDPVDATLSADEKAFFKDTNPFGFILFQRHCASPESVKRLVGELKSLTGRDRLPVLIDQEGGRVARLVPPCWPKYPPADVFSQLYKYDKEAARRAVRMNAQLIAHDLYELGITVNCAPLADVPVQGAHDVIGDRAFGHEPQQVVDLARAQADGLMDGGVVPVLKHIPGHGRAMADSHEETPVVDTDVQTLRSTDFVPFKALNNLPMGMTAHVLYTALDRENMATLSPVVMRMVREEIGF